MRTARHVVSTVLIGSLIAVPLAIVGCQEPEPPPAAYVGPTLTGADLGITQPACPNNGYVILQQGEPRDRFPGAVGIARLMPAEDKTAARQWRLSTVPEQEATYWNALFNPVAAVREVVMLDTLSVETADAGIGEIADAARRMKADLCLIWGPRSAPPDHAALMGVVMDTRRIEPVAFLQAEAGPEDFLPPAKDHFEEDRRHEDVNYLVARKFDSFFRACIFELINRDQPTDTTQPSPWKGTTTMPAGEWPMVPFYVVPNQPAGW